MPNENTPPSDSVDSIVRRLLVNAQLRKVYDVEEDVLWECLRKLAKMVRDAKPMVERDARMMADLTRFAPLSPEDQAKHDSTEFPSEIWIQEFERLTS